MTKCAILSGITGQDGSYLAEILLEKGYYVIGLKRRSSSINTDRVDHLYNNTNFHMKYWDTDDPIALYRYIEEYCPIEFYHLASQSHVRVSFDIPEHTFNTTAIGTLRILEILRGAKTSIKFYQASSSEMFGAAPPPQNELTVFDPQSPYAIGKCAAYYFTKNYRNAYGQFACNGILFNHESPRRGETFVTRKITRAVAAIETKKQNCLYLGNLYAKRDWGYAKDYMEAAYLMMQQEKPDDYVIATGETHTVKEFCELAFQHLGYQLKWRGSGIDEIGFDARTGREIIKIDPKYFRPTEVDILQGDSTRARTILGWKPKTSFKELVGMMVEGDFNGSN
jgi:GDPmannose 4,6-dehydratase